MMLGIEAPRIRPRSIHPSAKREFLGSSRAWEHTVILDSRYEVGRKEGAVRRIFLLALVAALMAAMMVVGTGTAFAVEQDSGPVPLYLCTGGDDYDTYLFVPES